MNRRSPIILVLFLGILFTLTATDMAQASGFFHPDIGPRTSARGGANVVGGDDLSAFWMNTANLANVDGTNIYLATSYEFFHTYYRREPYQGASRNINPYDNVQFAGLSSDFGLDTWTFGFGVFGPYAVTNRWKRDGPQRYNIVEANVFMPIYALTAAWNPIKYVRIGAQASLVNFRLVNEYGFSVLHDRNPEFDVIATLDAWSEFTPGYAFGIVIAPIPDWLEIGFSYNGQYDVIIEGDISAEMPKLYGTILGENPYTDKLRMDLTFPPIYRGGIRFIYKKLFDIEFASTFIPWTKLPYYDINFEKGDIIEDFKYPLEWDDTFDFRLGGTWFINEHWRLHGGAAYEQTANPPHISGLESPRKIGAGGFTMSYFGMDFDASYMHIYQEDVETPLPGPDFASELDDGRGKYKTSYDVFVGAINFNIERMYEAFNGHRPW